MNNKLSILFLSTCIVSVQVFAVDGDHGSLVSVPGPTDNNEVCVYCHTPHSSNTAFSPAPMWNKPTPLTAFTMYGATTDGVAGQTMSGTTTDALPSGSTLSCLSCHDGASAINSVINAPGPGRYDINGINIGQFALPGDPVPGFSMISDEWKAVGKYGDLANDHPVSIEYIPGKAGLRPLNTPLVDFVGAERVSQLLKDGKVQCTSCHDPHGTGYNMYLRNHNNASSLCLACHEK